MNKKLIIFSCLFVGLAASCGLSGFKRYSKFGLSSSYGKKSEAEMVEELEKELKRNKGKSLDLGLYSDNDLQKISKYITIKRFEKVDVHAVLFNYIEAEQSKRLVHRLEGNLNLSYYKKVLVLISRPYNGFDSGLNLEIPKIFKDMGILLMPIDFLPLDNSPMHPQYPNMYWRYGQRILSAAHFIKQLPNCPGKVDCPANQ